MKERSVVLLIDAVSKGHATRLQPKVEDRGFTAPLWNISATKRVNLNITVPEIRVHVGGSGWRLPLKELRSVWINCRFPAPESLPGSPDFVGFAQDEWEAALGNLYYLTRDRTWVNPLDRDFISRAKLQQLTLAERAGLPIPLTLVTLDPKELRSFFRSCPEGVAIKRLNDKPALFRASSKRMLYTNRIQRADLARLPLDSIRLAPCFFQEYIPKRSELRVYVVGDRVFSAEIFSQLDPQTEVDWRRYPRKAGAKGWEIDYDRWRCSATELPAGIEKSCRTVVREMGLRYAAIDLIKTNDGRYVFLEANNPGAWGWIERRTGLPITDAIADVLVADGAPNLAGATGRPRRTRGGVRAPSPSPRRARARSRK